MCADRRRESGPPPAGKIGPYSIIRKIGAGGAGEVYACRDNDLGRTVAVKILHSAAAGDTTRRDRFVREGRMMARISSPHVVAIFGFGDAAGRPYLVMEYIEGEDLETRLLRSKRPLRAPEAMTYARDAARGLMAASKLDIVHRDVKPANIVVVDGQAKLTDFGLARPQDGSAMVTSEGLVTGTPAFLAPERARAVGDDVRSDIYSLGATLFTLLAGRPPYIKETPLDVITAHLREPVPRVRSFSKSVSPALDDLVARMMAKKPEDRFASYQELLAAMEPVLALEVVGNHSGPSAAASAAPSMPESSGMVGIPTGVMGSLKRMGLMEIIQMLELGKKTARLEIIPSDGPRGVLGVKDGQVLFAQQGRRFAEKAFYHLMRIRDGGFSIHYGTEPSDINISRPTAFLLIEAVRREDEIARGLRQDEEEEEDEDAFGRVPRTAPEEEARHVDLRPAPDNIPHSDDTALPSEPLVDDATMDVPEISAEEHRGHTESISDADLVDVDPTLHSAPILDGGAPTPQAEAPESAKTDPAARPIDRTDALPLPDMDRTLMEAPAPVFSSLDDGYHDADDLEVSDEGGAEPDLHDAETADGTDALDEATAEHAAPAAASPGGERVRTIPRDLSAPMMAATPKWAATSDVLPAGRARRRGDRAPPHEIRGVPTADDAFDRADTLITDLPTMQPRRKPALQGEHPVNALPRMLVDGAVRACNGVRHQKVTRDFVDRFPLVGRIDSTLRDALTPLLDALDRRPWLLWAFCASFLFTVVLVGVLASSGARPSMLSRIKAGESAAVLEEIDAIPLETRSGRASLYRGHALAKLERGDEAMVAYARALEEGRSDARALGVVVERIDAENPAAEMALLTRWPGKKRIEKRLREKVKYGAYYERMNASAVLEARDAESGVEQEVFFLKNLEEAPTCETRQVALEGLRAMKATSDAARDAVVAAQKRPANLCMEALFREMLPHAYAK